MSDELTEACNCACLYLPIGWTIEISLEKDSGGVNLFDPFGDVVYFPRDDMTLAEQIDSAVAVATLHSEQGATKEPT